MSRAKPCLLLFLQTLLRVELSCVSHFRASALVSMLRHSTAPTAAYPTMAAVEALAAVVCEPGARTTDPILRHALLSEIGALGRPLFALFNHPASTP